MQTIEASEAPTRVGRLPLVVLLLAGYCVPAALVPLGVVSFPNRYVAFGMMALSAVALAWMRRYTAHQLGFRRDTLVPSLVWNGVASVALSAVMLCAYSAHLIPEAAKPAWRYFFVFYVVVSSPIQEFLFRSVPFAEFDRARVSNPCWRVAISAVVFCYVHLMYGNPVTLMVALVGGILWGVTYQKFPNFWGVALSHAVVGAVSIHVGLV